MMSSTILSTNEFGPHPKFVSINPYSCGSDAVTAAPAMCLLSLNQYGRSEYVLGSTEARGKKSSGIGTTPS